MTSRFVSSLLTAVLLAGSYSAEAAVKLGRQFTGARDDDERTRVLTERPLASQGLKGLREQGRSALRPAKLGKQGRRQGSGRDHYPRSSGASRDRSGHRRPT